jgi:hypothetical protein
MVDEYIIHHDASLYLHNTISLKQDIIIFMVIMQSICGNMRIVCKCKSSLVERAMGAFSLSNIITLLQTKHLKEQVFNILVALMEEYCKHWAENIFKILSLLSTNLGKEQLFDKVVTTKVSLPSL